MAKILDAKGTYREIIKVITLAEKYFGAKHYRSWSRYADLHYDETYCHICGEPDVEFEDRCAAKPICVHCWSRSI